MVLSTLDYYSNLHSYLAWYVSVIQYNLLLYGLYFVITDDIKLK